MKSKLYKVALISSPLLALIAAAPVYILEEKEIVFFIAVWAIMTFFIFIFWQINIYLISKIDKNNIPKRYAISYFIVFLFQSLNIFILTYLEFKPKEYNIILPFLGAIALNTIIIIISNSIILQFQKESAEIEVEQLKVQNLEAQKQILLQQLQPHFLFNTLSTLKSLINENPISAENYVIKLSDFLRYSAQAKNNEVVSLEEELKFSKDYFDLQKVRFGDALFSQVEISDEYRLCKVPVYAIQTLVENAIKHNSFTEKKPLIINISIVDNKIKISNNKVAKTLVLPSGTGLQNLNLRYKMVADTEIKIEETEEHFSVLLNLL
jgi:two-component system LytT family sensor kinase